MTPMGLLGGTGGGVPRFTRCMLVDDDGPTFSEIRVPEGVVKTVVPPDGEDNTVPDDDTMLILEGSSATLFDEVEPILLVRPPPLGVASMARCLGVPPLLLASPGGVLLCTEGDIERRTSGGVWGGVSTE